MRPGDPAAEVQKLAHRLGVSPSRLAFLLQVHPDELGLLRRQVAQALFVADRQHFVRIAAAATLVPVGIAARITERALPPLIAARTAELLDPSRALQMVLRLSDGYLADVAAALEPGRVRQVIAALPAQRVAAVAAELARRGAWVVIGGFVPLVSEAALRACLAVLTGEQLLRIGYVLEDMTRLPVIADLLTDEQLDQLLGAAVDGVLWRELDEVVAALDAGRAGRLAQRCARSAAPLRRALSHAGAAGALRDETLARLDVR